jgi:hypothetical protein
MAWPDDPEDTLSRKAAKVPVGGAPIAVALPSTGAGAARRRFAILATGSLVAGLAIRAAELAWAYAGSDFPPPSWWPDAGHLLQVGVPAGLVGLWLVGIEPSIAPDPLLRKGLAPRAFWVFVLGLLLHACTVHLAGPDKVFLAVLSLAGLFLEVVGGAMLAAASLRKPR